MSYENAKTLILRNLPAPSHPSRGAPIFTVFGCRGGAGATTVAVNLAARMAQSGPRGAVIVDLDVQLGDVLCALNIEPRATFVDILDEIDRLEPAALRRRLAAHPSGIYVLSQASNFMQLEGLQPERIETLLNVLARHFEAVIVDGVRDFGDLALPALDCASQILMVLTADVPAVRAAARSAEVFRELGFPEDKLFVVVNRHRKRASVDLPGVVHRMALPVRAAIANDFKSVEHAVNHGVLLVEALPRARVSRDLRLLADKLLLPGAEVVQAARAPKQAGRRGLARWFGRAHAEAKP